MKAPTSNKQIWAAPRSLPWISFCASRGNSPTVAFLQIRSYRVLIAVVVVVTIVVAIFPVTIVTVVFTIFVPFSLFALVPLAIVPSITVTLVPFAVVAARHDDGKLLR